VVQLKGSLALGCLPHISHSILKSYRCLASSVVRRTWDEDMWREGSLFCGVNMEYMVRVERRKRANRSESYRDDMVSIGVRFS
jgi:hypothetical protein